MQGHTTSAINFKSVGKKHAHQQPHLPVLIIHANWRVFAMIVLKQEGGHIHAQHHEASDAGVRLVNSHGVCTTSLLSTHLFGHVLCLVIAIPQHRGAWKCYREKIT